MKGVEFIRKVKRRGKRLGIRVVVVETRGKGDHVTLYFGDRFTIVGDQRKELKSGTMHAMLRQLGLGLRDLEG